MNDANGKHFFQMLSVFIEKMNKKFFTPELMKIMIDIAKNIFAFINRCDLFKVYLDYILLNERIYRKFEYNVQIELWEQLKTFQISDEDGFNKLISIKQLTRILLNTRCGEHCGDVVTSILLRVGEVLSIPQIVEDLFNSAAGSVAAESRPCLIHVFLSLHHCKTSARFSELT